MILIALFSTLQILIAGFVMWRGGAPERVVALLLLAAGSATFLLPYDPYRDYHSVYWPLFLIDLALFFELLIVALLADRFWPMWLAALQLVAVANHGVRGYDAEIIAFAYWLIASKIAYPMLMLLIAATARHRTRRRHGLPEFSWTFQRLAHERRADRSDKEAAR